ncbi:MAG: cell surface protein SprA, partial [Porphyromonadaceae bacterium]|nr:cell surface protein SprA [Porphyromonadaceae bacterium]
VRNSAGLTRSVEVWVNELRASDYHEEAGWAGQLHSTLQLAELGEASLRAQYVSAGFGAIDAPLMSRTLESRRAIQFASTLELGQLLPPEAKVTLPIYYTVSDEVLTPQYNPLDEDVKLTDALSDLSTERERKELRARSLTHRRSQGLALSKVAVGIRSEEPMPYDPANLSFSYGHNTSSEETPDIEYSRHLDWHAALRYDYTPTFRPLRPFAKASGASPWADFLRQYTFTPWPSRLVLETSMVRRYDEEQLRSLGDELSGTRLPATFAQQFIWNRRLQLNWNPTRSLQLTFNSGTDARIEEPHVQVNRQLQPDAWRAWRDSVGQSIREGGTPVHYAQQASLSYQLPTADIAPLSFIRSQLSYSSAYSWDRGAVLPDPTIRLAHTLMAQGALESTTQLQLRQLYQHIPALARLERRFGTAGMTTTEGRGKKSKGVTEGNELIDRLLYALLMVKDVSLTYRSTRSTLLPGFLPTIRAIGGQGSSGGALSPGVGFAFGLSDVDFIDHLAERGDLLISMEPLTPGVFTPPRTVD